MGRRRCLAHRSRTQLISADHQIWDPNAHGARGFGTRHLLWDQSNPHPWTSAPPRHQVTRDAYYERGALPRRRRRPGGPETASDVEVRQNQHAPPCDVHGSRNGVQ